MTNPRNITPHALQGKPLPSNWRNVAKQNAEQANAAYLNRLQNAWRNAGTNAANHLAPMQAARLRSDSMDYAHSGHNVGGERVLNQGQTRCDGQMQLIEERSDGWQHWRDATTGATVWRRIEWADLIGQK